jgi:amidase
VVARLRAAGTVRVGKTNVPEFAAGSHTFNPLFGVTHNPYRHGLSAGGPAGARPRRWRPGSCRSPTAATSAARCATRQRSATSSGCGPRPGRVPTWPAAMAWSQLSVQGPMGRTVADVALALSAMAGPDRRVPIALDDPGAPFAAPLPERLDGLRVAWAPDLGGLVPVDPAIPAVLRGVLPVVESLGAQRRGGLPRPAGGRRGVRHAARVAVRGHVRRRRPPLPEQGQGRHPRQRAIGRR